MTFLELLKEKDMTQARLARKLKVTRQTVNNWVKGKNTPKDMIVCIDIAKALGVETEIIAEILQDTKLKKREETNHE